MIKKLAHTPLIFAVIPVSPEIPRFFCFFLAHGVYISNGSQWFVFITQTSLCKLMFTAINTATVSFLVNNQSLFHKSFQLDCQTVFLSSCQTANCIATVSSRPLLKPTRQKRSKRSNHKTHQKRSGFLLLTTQGNA